MKHSFLNNLQKCKYKEYDSSSIVEGYVLAKRDSKNHYLVYTINGNMGHDCGVGDYNSIQQRDGYEFYISEEEFELLIKDERMWYVSEDYFINIIEVENNTTNINVTVDENGKILITKD